MQDEKEQSPQNAAFEFLRKLSKTTRRREYTYNTEDSHFPIRSALTVVQFMVSKQTAAAHTENYEEKLLPLTQQEEITYNAALRMLQDLFETPLPQSTVVMNVSHDEVIQ